MHTLQAAGVTAGVVEDVADVVTRDPHLRVYHFEELQDRDQTSTYLTHAQPIRFDGRQPQLRRPPIQGEHNEYVLKEILGISDEEYVQLLIDGVLH